MDITQNRTVPITESAIAIVDGVPLATCPDCGGTEQSVMFINHEPLAICACAPPVST